MWKKIWLLALATLIVVSLMGFAACGESDSALIKDTVVGFVTAYNDENFAHCLDFYSQQLRNQEGDSMLLSNLRAARILTGVTTIKGTSEPTITGSTATISLTLVTTNLGERSNQYYLVKEGDNWRIDRQ